MPAPAGPLFGRRQTVAQTAERRAKWFEASRRLRSRREREREEIIIITFFTFALQIPRATLSPSLPPQALPPLAGSAARKQVAEGAEASVVSATAWGGQIGPQQVAVEPDRTLGAQLGADSSLPTVPGRHRRLLPPAVVSQAHQHSPPGRFGEFQSPARPERRESSEQSKRTTEGAGRAACA